MLDASVFDDLVRDLLLVLGVEVTPTSWAGLAEGHSHIPLCRRPQECARTRRRVGPPPRSLSRGGGLGRLGLEAKMIVWALTQLSNPVQMPPVPGSRPRCRCGRRGRNGSPGPWAQLRLSRSARLRPIARATKRSGPAPRGGRPRGGSSRRIPAATGFTLARRRSSSGSRSRHLLCGRARARRHPVGGRLMNDRLIQLRLLNHDGRGGSDDRGAESLDRCMG